MSEKKYKQEIKVIVKNPPTKKEAEIKIKELGKYLSANWHVKINTKP